MHLLAYRIQDYADIRKRTKRGLSESPTLITVCSAFENVAATQPPLHQPMLPRNQQPDRWVQLTHQTRPPAASLILQTTRRRRSHRAPRRTPIASVGKARATRRVLHSLGLLEFIPAPRNRNRV